MGNIIMKFSFVLALAAVADAAKIKKTAKTAGLTKELMQTKKEHLLQTMEKTGDCMDWDILEYEVDAYGDGCEWYYGSESSCGDYDTDWFDAADLCCACGGGI